MFKFIEKVKNYVMAPNSDEYEDYDEYENEENYYEDETQEVEQQINTAPRKERIVPREATRVLSVHTNVKSQVILAAPQQVEETSDICEYILSNKAVVLNLETVGTAASQRIIDFIGGVAHAVGGDVRSISNKIFIVTPKNVEINDFLDEDSTSGVNFPLTGTYGSRY